MTVLDRSIDVRIWRDADRTRIALTRGDHVRLVQRPFVLHPGVGGPLR